MTQTRRGRNAGVNVGLLSDERYTPKHLVTFALKVLGKIDLDPASNPGVPNIPARHHFRWWQDGLRHPWRGKVWLNPPYLNIDKWIDKALAEYKSGRTTEILMLLPNYTGVRWFHKLDDFPIRFHRGRVTFANTNTNAPQDHLLVYMGKRHRRFTQVCDGKLGAVYAPYSWLNLRC